MSNSFEPSSTKIHVFVLFLHISIGSGKEDIASDQGYSRLVINVPVTNGDKTHGLRRSFRMETFPTKKQVAII